MTLTWRVGSGGSGGCSGCSKMDILLIHSEFSINSGVNAPILSFKYYDL